MVLLKAEPLTVLMAVIEMYSIVNGTEIFNVTNFEMFGCKIVQLSFECTVDLLMKDNFLSSC